MKWKRSSPPALSLVGTMPLSTDLQLQASQLSNVPLPGEEPSTILGARSSANTPVCMEVLLMMVAH